MENSSSHQICKVANTVSFLSMSDQHRSSLLSGIHSNSIVVAFTLENHFFQNFLASLGPDWSCSQETFANNEKGGGEAAGHGEPGTAARCTCMPLDLWAHPTGKGESALAFF